MCGHVQRVHHLAGSGNASHLGHFTYAADITIDPGTGDGSGTVDETAAIAFRGESLQFLHIPAAPCVRIRTTRTCLSELIDGERSMEEAIWEERIQIKGAVEDLLALSDGFACWLKGAVRSPAAERVLQELRR